MIKKIDPEDDEPPRSRRYGTSHKNRMYKMLSRKLRTVTITVGGGFIKPMVNERGELACTTIAKEIGVVSEAFYKWCRLDRISQRGARLLCERFPDTLKLIDFIPFMTDVAYDSLPDSIKPVLPEVEDLV